MAASDITNDISQEEEQARDALPPQTEEQPMPRDQVSDGNDVFPISCKRFVATLVHTHYEVYGKLLLVEHGRENHTPDEWHEIISGHSVRPAHPSL